MKYLFYKGKLDGNVKRSWNRIAGIITLGIFTIIFTISFVVFPDIGEKILYGKHPPEKKIDVLEYSQIIKTGNYNCIESSSIIAKGNFEKFVKEFNKCN